MKQIILISILFVLGCTPPVVFDQPYPLGEEDMIEIPSQYHGEYICESDSAVIVVESDLIAKHSYHSFKLEKKYIEERDDCKLVDDKMYVKGRLECIPMKEVNDSTVEGTVLNVDTLFYLGEESIARMHKGHMILNQKMKEGEWAVSLLTPHANGDVTYKAITKKTNVDEVSRITKTEEITTKKDKYPRYKIKPTMKEFDALLEKREVFVECEYLTKVKVEPFILDL